MLGWAPKSVDSAPFHAYGCGVRRRWVQRLGRAAGAWRRAVLLLSLLSASSPKAGEPPGFDYLLPAGGARGTSFPVFTAGRLDPWPVKVWTDDPGLVFKPMDDKGQFRVEVGAGTTPGPHLCRLYRPEGASAPFLFMVGETPELMEWELAEKPGRGALIPRLPVTINGRLKKPGETDAFWLTLEASHTLRAVVHAQRLDLPLVAALSLTDEQGVALASSVETPGGDPEFSCLIKRTGNYRLLLKAGGEAAKRDPRFGESDAAVYRLGLSSERFEPPLVDESQPNPATPETEILRPFQYAQQVVFPCTVHGHIATPAEQDRYVFEARQGQQFPIALQAASLGSPLAGVLKVLDGAGNALIQSAPAANPGLNWTAPADGEYTLVIADANSRGGLTYSYQLELGPPRLYVAATVSGHAFRVQPGAAVEVPVEVVRPRRHEAILLLVALDLPEGVTAGPGLAPSEGGEVRIVLTAGAAAPPANQPFRIVLTSPDPLITPGATALAGWPPRYAAPGQLLINQTDRIWLTVLPRPAAAAGP